MENCRFRNQADLKILDSDDEEEYIGYLIDMYDNYKKYMTTQYDSNKEKRNRCLNDNVV